MVSTLLGFSLPIAKITGVNHSVAEATQHEYELVGSTNISIGTSLETIRQHIGIENGVRAELGSNSRRFI